MASRLGGGSRKGRPNKLTRDIKEMMVTALNLEGGVEYLRERARDNPVAFLALVGRVLPLQVSAGDGGAILIVTGIVRPEDGITVKPIQVPSATVPQFRTVNRRADRRDTDDQQANALTRGGWFLRPVCLLSYCSG